MNQEELICRFSVLQDKKKKCIKGKNEDYAKSDSAFSNFEYSAACAGIEVEQVFMVFLGTKLARLKELLSGKTPNNESVRDTLMDLSNYADLLAVLLDYKEYLKKQDEFPTEDKEDCQGYLDE